MKISIQQLEYLISVTDEGSFSGAARILGISQPALSMQIKTLEDTLGYSLIDRGMRKLKLTFPGERFVEQARKVVAEYKLLNSLINDNDQLEGGTIRIGIIPTIAPYILPQLLRAVKEEFPNLQLEFQELKTQFLIEGIQKDMVDIGILAGPIQASGVEQQLLYHEKFAAYLGPNLASTTKQLNNLNSLPKQDILLLEKGHCMRNQSLKICSWASNNAFTLESGSLDTLIRLCDLDLGWTIIPELTVSQLNDDQIEQVRFFNSPTYYRSVYAITSKYSYKRTIAEKINSIMKTLVNPKFFEEPNGECLLP